jgi:exopolysaccharide biosynthesis protein
LSVGLTQPQLAGYMRWLGAYQAMEFDSGGSVTMAVRFPGHPAPTVVNSPSDGHERPVANALLVFSKPVVTGPLAHQPGG